METQQTTHWYGKQTTCCIGSTERLQHAPARDLTLMTMDDDSCSLVAAASSTNWADAMDFHAAMVCPIGLPAFACCGSDAGEGFISIPLPEGYHSRRDIENVHQQSVQLIVLVSMLPTMPGILKLVRYSDGEMRPMVTTAVPALEWFSGRPACPRRPHCPRCPTHNTHT